MEEQNESPSLSFVIPQKIDAFCRSFAPASSESEADQIFTDARLRQYFQAYPRPTGDPLSEYCDILAEHHFHWYTCITGEPAILVKERFE